MWFRRALYTKLSKLHPEFCRINASCVRFFGASPRLLTKHMNFYRSPINLNTLDHSESLKVKKVRFCEDFSKTDARNGICKRWSKLVRPFRASPPRFKALSFEQEIPILFIASGAIAAVSKHSRSRQDRCQSQAVVPDAAFHVSSHHSGRNS